MINQTVLKPSLVEAAKMTDSYTVIPVSCELYADMTNPIALLRVIRTVASRYYLLESVENTEKWGRYSFLGFDPLVEVTCKDGKATIKNGSTIRVETDNPQDIIRNILSEYKSPSLPGLPPFTGGFVGYFAYDFFKYTEPTLKINAPDTTNFADMDMMLFDKVIAFDHLKQKLIIIINIKTDHLETNYIKAELEMDSIIQLIKKQIPLTAEPFKLTSPFSTVLSQQAYSEMIEKAKEYIYNGDIFQVVLSNRYQADMQGSLFNLYRVLRTTNPSPYMYFIKCEGVEIAGTSPETLVRLKDGELSTFPIAGTRPRGATDEEDAKLAQELLADEKELSEHNMLVDLGRNDLGKVCEFGSIKVKNYMTIQKYSHVMHIASTVTGIIKPQYDQLDALQSALVAGTLSGAPKLRACEIIDELEPVRRGIYGGAIGYIDFAGNMDVCIAIRTAVAKDNKIYVQAGAGIVADSQPESEYNESANKAKAVLNAALTASEEIDL